MADPQLPVWIECVSKIGPTAIAASVAYVAWRQWRTQQAKLAFDLFEHRLKIYLAVQKLYDAISIHGEVSPEDFNHFIRQLNGAQFLFTFPLRRHVETIQKMAGDAMHARQRSKNSPGHPLLGKLLDEEDQALNYLRDNRRYIERAFRDALDLTKT